MVFELKSYDLYECKNLVQHNRHDHENLYRVHVLHDGHVQLVQDKVVHLQNIQQYNDCDIHVHHVLAYKIHHCTKLLLQHMSKYLKK